jgi:UDP-N-acetylmuramoyl-tripeptide--D-alanyl-D-alanine ligase
VTPATEGPRTSAAFTLEDVLAATGGELSSLGATTRFGGVVTDSRAVRAGELFVALRGDAHDGHAFVAEAASRGAGAVLIEERTGETLPTCGVVVVRDTLAALGDLAALHRHRSDPRVVAITGSNGKTTSKEMLGSILEHALGREHVLRTQGTQNNLVGLPLTLLGLDAQVQVAVLEMGMNGPGEIWRLAEIADPDVGVITCVARAHLEGLGSMRGVAEAKAELFRRLRPQAIAVYNADDPYVAAAAPAAAGRRIGFGLGEEATVRAIDVTDDGLAGIRFRLRVEEKETPVALPVPGRHNVTNALAAAGAAYALGIPLDAVARGLDAFRPAAMRMEVVALPSGVTVLNDAYNANPASMAAALATLRASAAPRRFAALGSMRELGDEAAAAHRELGSVVARAGLDGLFLIGTHAPDVRGGAEAAGMPAAQITIAATHEELAGVLRSRLRSGDLLLLKGSRGATMETVLVHLRTEN